MERIEVLWEDRSALVCVKPAGVLSQAGKPGEASMVSLLQARTGGEIYPIHRLDRAAGGVMVYAKTAEAAARLSRELQQGRLAKEYLAVLKGTPEAPAGMLRDLLFHDRSRNRTYVVTRSRKGVREAKLFYRTLDRQDGLTLVQVRLLTGRTHQIRAQFSTRGLPLLGDGPYGGGSGALCLWSMALTLDPGNRPPRRFLRLPDSLGPFSGIAVPEPLEAENLPEIEKKA